MVVLAFFYVIYEHLAIWLRCTYLLHYIDA